MSVTAPEGFVANGVACGIKPAGRPDLALVATTLERAVPAAGVFTTNLATAAPVQVSRRHLLATAGRARAVVLNSGNANAATGAVGIADAE
ncbi:MAG: bifunctional ornithine acetyltransferase/N-acetylglutamate synthase, partial [Acidimicrobiales bacterium]